MNAQFGKSFSTVPSEWAIEHVNVEAEGLVGGEIGYAMKNLKVSLV